MVQQEVGKKLRIAVMSDTRLPTPYVYGHGLGRAVYNVAKGLVDRGHSVTLFGLTGSHLPFGTTVTISTNDEEALAAKILARANDWDVAIDASHSHALALNVGDKLPTIAYFQDRESAKAPNAVFVSFDQMGYVGLQGYVVRNGVDENFFTPSEEDYTRGYLLFMGGAIYHKGLGDAKRIADLVGMELQAFGPGLQVVSHQDKVEVYRRAFVTLCPYRIDAGPQVPLESMACGTPVVGLKAAAMVEYVPHGGGYLGRTVEEMAGLTLLAMRLPRESVRKAVLREEFTTWRQVVEMEILVIGLAQGRRW